MLYAPLTDEELLKMVYIYHPENRLIQDLAARLESAIDAQEAAESRLNIMKDQYEP